MESFCRLIMADDGTYLVIVAHKLPICSFINDFGCPVILESSVRHFGRASRSIEVRVEVVRIELQHIRVYVEKCTKHIESNIGDEAAGLEDDGASRKVVRLVGHFGKLIRIRDVRDSR